jgi:Apea-like HEPN
MPAATLRILVRNVESDAFNRDGLDFVSPLRLQFSDFSVEYLHQGSHQRLEYAREFFVDAMYDDCLVERPYLTIPPLPQDIAGFGAITNEPENLLLLLRLFRPGDLAFIAVSIQKSGEMPSKLYPYRVISNLVTESTRQFTFRKDEVSQWESFAASLRTSPSWHADWFRVARRSFLYGMSKEFNPNFESEVDRVVDYVTALEATLVAETEFVGRRLKNRAIKLLKLVDEEASRARKLLTDMYSIRSTLVHGGSLGSQLNVLQDQVRWIEFEKLVRDLLVAGLNEIPPNDGLRRSFLTSLYDPNDTDRAEEVVKNFRSIKNNSVRENLVTTLKGFTLQSHSQGDNS